MVGLDSLVLELGRAMANSCRSYAVLNYWPRPNVTVPQVKSTYNKMLSSEMNGKQASIQHTNGQVNAAA